MTGLYWKNAQSIEILNITVLHSVEVVRSCSQMILTAILTFTIFCWDSMFYIDPFRSVVSIFKVRARLQEWKVICELPRKHLNIA